jgi:hypothetical protein
MFGDLAPRLRAAGWKALIPLQPSEKRPVFAAWQFYNRTPPAEAKIAHWAATLPQAGIGLAYGPDEVAGVDLDFLDAPAAEATLNITIGVLGATPLVRIGRAPKKLLLYRLPPGLPVPGKNFGGFELFSRSGQTVLFGRHPDGFDYRWPGESPLTVAPADLPEITSQSLADWLQAMTPYHRPIARKPSLALRAHVPKPPKRAPTLVSASDVKSGAVAEVLPCLRAAADPLTEAARLVDESAEGSRRGALCRASSAWIWFRPSIRPSSPTTRPATPS